MKKAKLTIKLNVPAGEAKNVAPVGPILGQNQINIVEFCRHFNGLTEGLFSTGIDLKVKVLKFSDNSKQFKIGFFRLSNLIEQFIKAKDKRYLYKSDIQDILKIYGLVHSHKLYKNDIQFPNSSNLLKSILGTLESMNIKVLRK